MSDQAIPPSTEAAKPKPTPITILVESTAKYENDMLVFTALNECLAKMHVVRVMATDETSVANLARHWCRKHNIRFTLILLDPSISPKDDRARRVELIIGLKPHAVILFNQFDRWLEFANAYAAAGIPTTFCHPTQENFPKWIKWEPGHSPPQTPTMKWVTGPARRARHAQRVTEEHKRDVRRRHNEIQSEKRRLKRLMARIAAGTTSELWRNRRRGPRRIRPGHRMSVGP